MTILDAYQVRGQFTRRRKPLNELSALLFFEN